MRNLLLAFILLGMIAPAQAREIWTPAEANAWYAKQKWLVGSNYIPANAINQLEMWQEASFDPGTIVYEPVGCAGCEGTGFKGRIGVFEAIRVDDTIRRLINDGGDEAIIARHAFLHAPNLGSAARRMVRAGQTTPEEAVRVSRREASDG